LEGTGIVLQRDFRELRQTTAFRVLMTVSAIAAIGGSIGISIALSQQAWLGEHAARPILEMITSLVVYFLPFSILIAFIWASASLPLTKEKVNGIIESLLATPLTPQSIWAGKSLAVFLPGYALSVVATFIILLAANLGVIVPATGNFVFPVPAIITGLIINPLLFFGLLSFIILFSLANNPDVAIAPSFLVGFGLIIGIPLGIATGFINLASWSFALWYLAATLIAGAIVAFLSRLLTKENIVLSSKGE